MDHHTQEHLHESPPTMTLPLILLGLLALVGGLVAIPQALGGHNWIHEWLGMEGGVHVLHGEESESLERIFAGMSVGWAALWASVALLIYTKKPGFVRRLAEGFKGLYQLLFNKYYIDELYDRVIVRPLNWISQKVLWKGVDSDLIDGLIVNGSARASEFLGQVAGAFQSGVVNSYALYFLIGILGFLWWVWRG